MSVKITFPPCDWCMFTEGPEWGDTGERCGEQIHRLTLSKAIRRLRGLNQSSNVGVEAGNGSQKQKWEVGVRSLGSVCVCVMLRIHTRRGCQAAELDGVFTVMSQGDKIIRSSEKMISLEGQMTHFHLSLDLLFISSDRILDHTMSFLSSVWFSS